MGYQKIAGQSWDKLRVQNATTDVMIKPAPGILGRIVVANGDAAKQTVTIKDGTITQQVVQVPAGDTRSLEYNAQFTTSIVITPSSANIDALVMFL